MKKYIFVITSVIVFLPQLLFSQISFGSKQIITNSLFEPRSVYAADIDNDGDLDVISASFSDNKITWYENDGSGNFGTQQIIDDNVIGANDVIAAYINNDSYIDIIVASSLDGMIYWYDNDGGNFNKYLVEPANGVTSISAAYINDDAFIDIISITFGDKSIEWFSNDGNGSFTTNQPITTTTDGAISLVATDIDSDNYVDVVYITPTILAWNQNTNGLGIFDPEVIIDLSLTSPTALHAFPANNNNSYIDIVATSYVQNKIFLYKNSNGNGSFQLQILFSDNIQKPLYVTTFDIDLDGDLDGLVTSETNGIFYYKYDGDIFSTKNPIIPETMIRDVFTADLDGDGDFDILYANPETGEVTWLENTTTPQIILQPVNNIPACEPINTMFFIEAEFAAEYQWQVNISGSFEDIYDGGVYYGTNEDTLYITNAPFEMNGYEYRCVLHNGAENTTSDYTVLLIDEFIQAQAGDNAQLCNETEYIMQANQPDPGIGSWSVTSGDITIDDYTLYNTLIQVNSLGNHSLTWNIYNGSCFSFDTVSITSVEVVSDAGNPIEMCDENQTVLSANYPMPGVGCWNIIQGGGNFSDISSANSLVVNILPGENIYQWTVAVGDCSDVDNVSVTRFISIDAYAGEDESICDETQYQLFANNTGTGIGQWSTMSDATIENINSPTTYVSNLVSFAGSYEFIWTITNGVCESTWDDVIISRYATAEAIAGDDDEICDTTKYQLNANIPLYTEGVWAIVSGGGEFSDSYTYNSFVDNIPLGENIYQWTIINGVCSDFDSITLISYETIEATAGDDGEICDNIDYQLSANEPSPGVGVWSYPSGIIISDISNSNAIISNLYEGENYLIWKITNGNCPISEDDVIITRFDPVYAHAGFDEQICDDTEYELNANEPSSGIAYWQASNGEVTFDNISANNTIARNLPAGATVFTWTINNSSCNSSAEITIIRDTMIYASVADSDSFCFIPEYQLFGNFTEHGISTWTCSDNQVIFDDINSSNATASNLSEGITTFTWEIINGTCMSADNFILNLESEPYVELGEDVGLKFGETLILDVGEHYNASYLWTPGNYITQTIEVSEAGIYSVKVTELCSATDSVSVFLEEIELDIPNAFTPNGDGINDTWLIPDLEYFPNTLIHIIDKHGNTMAYYTATEIPLGWDGTLKGEPVFSDTYWYVISFENGMTQTGMVTLKR